MSGNGWPLGLDGVARGVRRVAADPRAVGVAAAGPRTVAYLMRLRQRAGDPDEAETRAGVRVSPALAMQVLLDEVLIAAFRHPRLLPRDDDYPAAGADVAAARRLYAERGWLADPVAYHRDPEVPDRVGVRQERALDVRYEHVTFDSGWEPDPHEPRRDQWLAHRANRQVHAWMLRSPAASRSWLICVHGFGMGRPLMDIRGFRGTQLRRAGLNLLLPVLPLHGPRADGSVRGEGFMSIDLVDSKHGLAQAASDVRRAVRWLRAEHGAERIGLYGVSLGGHVVSLVAALEEGLDCVIAGIPVVDLPALYRRHSTSAVRRLANVHGALGDAANDVHRLVSPLAMPPRVAPEGRFVFGGLGDRMSTFDQSQQLWRHWGKPAMACYPGGHVGFFWSSGVQRFVVDALTRSGLVTAPEPAAVVPDEGW